MEDELQDLTKWTEYIEQLTKEFHDLPEVPPILASIEPTVFQYSLNDHPELNFWHAFDKNGIRGGMGENTEDNDYIKLIHKADFEVVRKVFSGEQNPIEATMTGIYLVEGDMTKLMACASLLPLQVVAHEKVTGSKSGNENSAACRTMEWPQEIDQIFEKVVNGIPEAVRPVVSVQLLEAAEEKCKERNGNSMAEVDLIVALFEITPQAFKPTVIEDLKKLGIDYDRYLPKVQSDFKCKNDLDQMVKDLVTIGDIVEVKSDVDKIWKVIRAYEKFFAGAPVSIRTTTKPVEIRDVAIRYVEFFIAHNPNPYITAINEGLIEKNGHPIHEMIVEAIDKFQIMGYGVDLDITNGMSKIWPFVVPESIDEVLSMKTIPDSIRNYEEYFKKHGLTTFALFAFDFMNKTTNLYFMLKQPPKSSYESCIALVEDLGLKVASEDIMKACLTAAHLNFTFNWESEKCERLCFGIGEDDYRNVPVHLHPMMKDFVDKTPLQSEKQKFVWGVTFTPNGVYYKIENDYNGTMVDFIGMGCKAGIEKYI